MTSKTPSPGDITCSRPPPVAPSPFLCLPFRLRYEIYTYAVNWPDLRVPFARLSRECERVEAIWESKRDPKCTFPSPRVAARTTPTILLLNRQITAEALPILRDKTLVLDTLPPYTPFLGRPMDITDFIGEATLQRVRRVSLKMDLVLDARGWAKTVETLLDVWCVKNSLVEVVVNVTNAYGDERNMVGEEASRQQAARLISKVSGSEKGMILEPLPDEEAVEGLWGRDAGEVRGHGAGCQNDKAGLSSRSMVWHSHMMIVQSIIRH